MSLKIIPAMKESTEQHFWQTANTEDYFDFSRAIRGRQAVRNYLDIAQPITIRLQPSLLNKIKVAARKKDIPNQTYLKQRSHASKSKSIILTP